MNALNIRIDLIDKRANGGRPLYPPTLQHLLNTSQEQERDQGAFRQQAYNSTPQSVRLKAVEVGYFNPTSTTLFGVDQSASTGTVFTYPFAFTDQL